MDGHINNGQEQSNHPNGTTRGTVCLDKDILVHLGDAGTFFFGHHPVSIIWAKVEVVMTVPSVQLYYLSSKEQQQSFQSPEGQLGMPAHVPNLGSTCKLAQLLSIG